MKTCSIEGCENKHSAKNYCSKHYRRFKKYGDQSYIKTERDNESHKMWNTTEYRTWAMMKVRCYNKKHNSYKYYGGRGIKVCDEWLNSFLTFYNDMGMKPFLKAQLDRINNNGDYEPKNCKWTSSIENSRHRSNAKLTMKKAKEIRTRYTNEDITQTALGLIYGVGQDSINLIIHNKTWKMEI